MTERFRLSADPSELDRDRVHHWLSVESYWAKGRPRSVQDRAIDGSLNFGAYRMSTGEQVGYARVVTDGVTFAWLCDVFVDESTRGEGVGRTLVRFALDHLDEAGVPRTMLKTTTAHGVYSVLHFEVLPDPEAWIVRVRNAPPQ